MPTLPEGLDDGMFGSGRGNSIFSTVATNGCVLGEELLAMSVSWRPAQGKSRDLKLGTGRSVKVTDEGKLWPRVSLSGPKADRCQFDVSAACRGLLLVPDDPDI